MNCCWKANGRAATASARRVLNHTNSSPAREGGPSQAFGREGTACLRQKESPVCSFRPCQPEREELSPEGKHSPPGPAAAAYIYPGQQPQPTPHGLCCPPTFRSWSALHLLLLTCPTPFPLTCGLSALLPEHGHRWAWVTHSLLLDAVASPPKPCCCHPPCINSFCKRVTCWFNKSLVIVIIYWLP